MDNDTDFSIEMESKTMNYLIPPLAIIFFTVSPLTLAQTYRCNVNGKVVYSQTKCAEDAAAVHIDPVPSDSLDNPEAAERYRLKKGEQSYQQAIQDNLQRQELQRIEEQSALRKAEQAAMQSELERKRHELALEQKIDGLKKEVKRARVQQSIDAERTRQAISGVGRDSQMTCRPNAMGTQLNCSKY